MTTVSSVEDEATDAQGGARSLSFRPSSCASVSVVSQMHFMSTWSSSNLACTVTFFAAVDGHVRDWLLDANKFLLVAVDLVLVAW